MVSGSLRASSTTKTGRHDIAERLLKVALKHTKNTNMNSCVKMKQLKKLYNVIMKEGNSHTKHGVRHFFNRK
jgi:hypothetical protein